MIGIETLRELVALGLSSQQILAVGEAMAVDARPKDATAAERKRRQRAKEANGHDKERDVSRRDVTRDPPNERDNLTPEVPSADADGADQIEVSPEAVLWGTGRHFLIRHGVAKTSARGILGKWKRDHGLAATVEALSVAERESRLTGGLVDPVAFIEGVFKHREPEMAAPLC